MFRDSHPVLSFVTAFLGLSLALSVVSGCATAETESNSSGVNDYQSCVDAGNPILRTYPGKCIAADGRTFIDPSVTLEGSRNASPGEGKTIELCKDLCGDGKCQQIVCMGQGCPCAEDPSRCPKDCASEGGF